MSSGFLSCRLCWLSFPISCFNFRVLTVRVALWPGGGERPVREDIHWCRDFLLFLFEFIGFVLSIVRAASDFLYLKQ